MSKYEVRIWEIYRTDIVVEAPNAREAVILARLELADRNPPEPEWVMEKDWEVIPIEPTTKSEIATASALSQGWDIVALDPATVEPQDYVGIPRWEGDDEHPRAEEISDEWHWFKDGRE